MKEEKDEEKELTLRVQSGPRDLLDAWYPQTDPHIPLLLEGEQGATPAKGSPGGASFYCRSLSKPRGCAPILISVGTMKKVGGFRDGEKGEANICSGHNWIWMDIR